MQTEINLHKPVLVKEVVHSIPLRNNAVIVDATLGAGGHSLAIIKKILASNLKNIQLITIDLDPSAWERLQQKLVAEQIDLNASGLKLSFVETNFNQLAESVVKLAADKDVIAVLADLGLSQNLLERAELGLSFRLAGPLDMRLASNLHVTAADLLNGLPKQHLRKLFFEYADIRYALSLAEAIADARIVKPLRTTTELNQLVLNLLLNLRLITSQDLEFKQRAQKLEYSELAAKELAKVYQALRIAVNLEYQNLADLVKSAWEILSPQAKLLVITFHSGEEKVLKRSLVAHKSRVILPQKSETLKNKRSRSAKLHVYTK